MTTTTPAKPAGGYRGTAGRARYTSQLVALVTVAMSKRVRDLASKHEVSQAKVLRKIIERGIEGVEKDLTDGTLRADTLA